MLRKTRVFTRFSGPVPCLFFHRFCSLFENVQKTLCSIRISGSSFSAFPELRCGFNGLVWGFGGPLPLFPTHFCNKLRKRLAHFLRFLTDMPQATCFHIFLMISPWISLSAFQALARKCSSWSFQKYYSKFPKPSMAQKYRFWAIWSYSSIFPEPYVGRNILLRLPCKTHLKVCIQRQMTRLIFGISWALAQK